MISQVASFRWLISLDSFDVNKLVIAVDEELQTFCFGLICHVILETERWTRIV